MLTCRKVLAVASLGAVLLAGAACAPAELTGESVTKTVPLERVTEVRINDGTLRIHQGTPTSLTVRTDKSVKRYLVTRQRDGVLELGVPDDADIRAYVLPPMPADAPIEFDLTTDSLDTIHLGGGEVLVDGFTTDRLLLDANTGRAVLANIDVDELRCEMNGGVADVTVSGIARLSSRTNSSDSRYDDSGLKSK